MMGLKKSMLTVCMMLFAAITVQAQEWYRFTGKNGKYGFKEIRYVVVKPIYDDAAVSYSEEMAAVKKNGKWGYIDKRTKSVVIPLQFDMAYSFKQGVAKVVTKDSTYYIDKSGKWVDPEAHKLMARNVVRVETKPIDPAKSPEALPITMNSKNGKTHIQLGTKKYVVSKEPKVNDQLQLTGDVVFNGKLSAPYIVHIPGFGLAGLTSKDDVHGSKAMSAKVIWAIQEDDGRAMIRSDDLFMKNFNQEKFTADRMLYFGIFEKEDYTQKKFRRTTSASSFDHVNMICYAGLYEGGKRVMLWEDVQHLLIHPQSSRLQYRKLYLKEGKNKSIAFINQREKKLTAFVYDSTLSVLNSYPNVSMVATNDGSSATAYTLNNAKFRNQDPFFGPRFGPWSSVYYTVVMPAELEGYYKVLDENNKFYAPENSYGLLPFVTTHKHIRRGPKALHRLDTTQHDFEMLHFFFAALKKNNAIVWQPVNFNGKPYPSQENEFFLHWELVDCKSLSKVNAIDALPYLLLAYTHDEKWQAFFPSKYGISFLPSDLLDQYKHAFPPLTDKCETAEDAYVKAEVQVQIIQNTHVKGEMKEYEIQKQRSDKMWEEYRRKHAGKPSQKVDWSGWSKMNSSWGGFGYTNQVSQQYKRTVSEGDQRRSLREYNNYLNHVIRRAGQ